MTTSTFYSATADGVVWAYSATYATARRGTGDKTAQTSATYNSVGQLLTGGNYYCYELFLDFDTSAIGDTDTIDTVTLSLNTYYYEAYTAFDVQARAFDWSSGGLTTADFRSGDSADSGSLDEYTLLASKSTSSGWVQNTYTDLTSESAFLTNVSKTGHTYIVLNSSRHLAGNTPSGYERMNIWMGDEAEGAEYRPKLTVVHTAVGGGTDVLDPFGMSGFFGA